MGSRESEVDIMELESVKATLAEIVEQAGENGPTETQAVMEINARHKLGYWGSLEAIKNIYQDAGLTRTPEHTGQVICYRKAKQEKQPEESVAVRLAKKLGERNIGEKGRMDILKHYIR